LGEYLLSCGDFVMMWQWLGGCAYLWTAVSLKVVVAGWKWYQSTRLVPAVILIHQYPKSAQYSPSCRLKTTKHTTCFFQKKQKKLKTPQKHHKTPQNTINPPKKPQKKPQNLKKRIKNSSKRLKTPKIDAQIEDLIRGAVFKKAFSHGGTAEILAKNDNRPMITIGG
jgi:hypothetical protein